MGEPEATMIRIGQGIALSQRGERDTPRELFTEVWTDIGGEHGDPLHRCALAHAMADVQDSVTDELAWDLLALRAADEITDERAAQAGVPGPVAGFYPSLHLNLGDCYRRLGQPDLARDHLHRGQAAIEALGDDGYARMITDGLDRLAARLTHH